LDSTNFKSALTVNDGIPQPPSVNYDSVARFKALRKSKLTLEEYVAGIISKNRTILSKAITLIESSLPEHQELAQKIIEKCLPYSGKSLRIGITGVPGVGKSSFIESMGMHVTSLGHKLAVLAIDPSSERSGGSILGDKTRMEQLSAHPDAFIRPSPSAGSLGGVARKTREAIYLCEAAGFDVIFIETVGVGQSETAVHSMVDFFLLLMLAGAGDELQGIKRGIMEMADAIAITKADGSNIDKASRAKAEYQSALHLFPAGDAGWTPKVLTCSAHNNIGIPEIWNTVADYKNTTLLNSFFEYNRIEQAKYWMHQTIQEGLKNNFYENKHIKTTIKDIESDVLGEKISSFEAARLLLNKYYKLSNNI
jgi:LAO/AO transport system kinase